MMKLIDLYFDSTSVIFASCVKRSGVCLVLSGGSLVPCGTYYLVYFTLSDKKMFFLALAARIHIPFSTVCIFLLSDDRNEFVPHIQRKCLGTQHHMERNLNSFTPPPSHHSGLPRVQSDPMASSLQDLKYIFRHSAQSHYNWHSLCQVDVHQSLPASCQLPANHC